MFVINDKTYRNLPEQVEYLTDQLPQKDKLAEKIETKEIDADSGAITALHATDFELGKDSSGNALMSNQETDGAESVKINGDVIVPDASKVVLGDKRLDEYVNDIHGVTHHVTIYFAPTDAEPHLYASLVFSTTSDYAKPFTTVAEICDALQMESNEYLPCFGVYTDGGVPEDNIRLTDMVGSLAFTAAHEIICRPLGYVNEKDSPTITITDLSNYHVTDLI